jgi:hypothetical protein
MTKPLINSFSPVEIPNIHRYKRYLPTAFDESLSILQKINKTIKALESLGEVSTDVISQWNTVMEWVMGDGLDGSVNAKLAAMLADGTLGNLINNVLLADITSQLSDPRQFGAKADGVNDDTAAIQLLLNSPAKSVVLRNGTFRITTGLTSSLVGRMIKCEGATILCDSQDITALTITGDYTKVNIDLNGNNKAAIGILVSGARGCDISNSKIENLYGQFVGGCGIKADTFKGVTIKNNIIRSVNALGNNLLGDNIGSSRAILVTSTSPAMYPNLIQGNVMENIIGEEGDTIQILFFDGTNLPFLEAMTMISGNQLKDFNRRGIKIQGSNVKVVDNTIINRLPVEQVPNAVASINIISSDNVFIKGNNIECGRMFVGISVVGGSTYSLKRVSVRNNEIKSGTDATAIYFDYITECSFNENTIYDGVNSISGSRSSNVNIQGNTLFGGNDETTQTAINVVSGNTQFFIRDNIIPNGKRLYMISNYAPNSIVENNHTRALAANIRSYAEAAGTIYRNNTNLSASTTYIGDFTDQYVEGGRNVGSGGCGTADIMFSSTPPTSANRHYNVGEVVFNTSAAAGGKVGWVCIGSGNPGNWKAFGVIDA